MPRRVWLSGVSDLDDQGSGRLRGLEPARVAAFIAFRRAVREADRSIAHGAAAHRVVRREDLALARRVYDGVEGTIDLVPGPGTINRVAVVAGTGERFAGDTSTSSAALDGLGYVRSARQRMALPRSASGGRARPPDHRLLWARNARPAHRGRRILDHRGGADRQDLDETRRGDPSDAVRPFRTARRDPR
jgi:hypothetical protein